VCAIADEVAFWRSEGANPDREIFTALRPCMANIDDSLLIAISSTYARTGVLWEASQRYGQDDPEILFWKAGTLEMNPAFKEKVIERALKEDYSAARSEYFAEFREDLETFLSIEVIDKVIMPGRFELAKQPFNYFAFVDSSGGRHDKMTLSVCHKEKSEKIIQDCIRVKKPPFDPGECVKEFAEVLKSYAINSVTGDKYAGEWVTSAFEKEGISYKNSELTKSEIYLEFLPLVMQGRIELLDHREQIIEFRQLERITGRGKDIVDHPRGLSDDIANAAAGACLMAIEKDSGAFIGLKDARYFYGEEVEGVYDLACDFRQSLRKAEIGKPGKKLNFITTGTVQAKEKK
jgi:hypothetical protein